jgi:hypothetical protein
MNQIAPPEIPPRVALSDDDGIHRMRLRLWQLSMTVLTVVLTAWFIALGPIPGIIAVLTAKHVLVAIYVMGIGVDAPREPVT